MIFKLKSPVKDYIWGGTKLRDEYGKTDDCERIAESWELSCHHDGLSIIEGMNIPLVEYLAKHPEAMGENCKKFDDFPILIKLIDARDNLSVQVHPNEKYAMEHEGEHGKTEMWYIIDCEPDSSIIYGFKDKITKKEFRQAIENNTLFDKLNIVPVHKGDVFTIKAGTLHAIGKGILLAEIQQSSNVTYRVYDYGRNRELHIDKAIDVARLTPTPPTPIKPVENIKNSYADDYKIINSKYFKVFLEHGNTKYISFHIPKKSSFTHVLVIEGNGIIQADYCTSETKIIKIKKGDSFFISAGSDWGILGNCSIIYTVI